MKKLFLSLLVAVAATVSFSSCGGGSNTPKDAVNTLTEAMKTGNVEAYLSVLAKDGKDGAKELSEKDKAKATEEFNKYKDDWAGMETEITSEEIEDDKDVANVDVLCKKNGAERKLEVELLNADGKWVVTDIDF